MYTARLRVVGEEPVTYGRFTDPVQFSVPSLPVVPAPVEDITLPRAAESPEGHSTSGVLSTLQTVVPRKFIAPFLFVVLSGLVLVLAFALGVFFKF